MRVLFVALMLFAFVPPVMAAEDVYICPMHPHIVGEEGDNCPICGMFLTPKEAEAFRHDHNGHDHGTHSTEPTKEDDGSANEATYMCPMHPHIVGEEGDNCPICGMHLTPKETEADPVHEEHGANDVEGAIRIDPSYVQMLGVKTAEARHHKFGKSVRAFGRLAPSSRLEYAVDVRTKGWVVDLPKSAVGDTVKKGDLLFTYYSPDLTSAQIDYLIGRGGKGAKQRLRLFGMDEKSIAYLNKKGHFLEETPFYAKADGTVTELNVREGSHVNEGGTLMTIQDFSKLWANVDVPERDVQFLKVGTPAKITVPETGESYEAAIDLIHPVSDPMSRTAMVRLVLDNPDGTLKPDTYIDAVFDADSEFRLAVASEAVLYSGMGAYVMENVRDGYFKPVMVETGITANGLTEIKSGLSHGQNIVTSGQFMLDAETNLRGGMAAMGHDHGDMAEQPVTQEGGHAHVH